MNDIVWSYRNSEWIEDADLVGYSVNAKDGPIGKIDEISTEVGASWLVVDTGFWIFGKKRLIPAGTVSGVDREGKLVVVNMTKAAIEAAPDHDSDEWDAAVQGRHSDHYREYVEGHEDEVRGPRPMS